MAKNRQEVLEEIAKMERLVADAKAGNNARCETCHQPLIYYGPGSGHHPGVFCVAGCTATLLEFKRSS